MRRTLKLLGILCVISCISMETTSFAYGMPSMQRSKSSTKRKNKSKNQGSVMSAQYRESAKYSNTSRAGRAALPKVFVPEGLRDAVAPAAVNQGPGSVQDAINLIREGDKTRDVTLYQQALGILQRVNAMPIFPSQKYTKADMYNLMGYASQKLAKTRSEYMTAEDFYKKALLIEPKNIQANKNLGKLYASLYAITGRDSFLDLAEKYEATLAAMTQHAQNALSSLTNDIENLSQDQGQKSVGNVDPDSDWYNTV